jgi:hypothetical protein
MTSHDRHIGFQDGRHDRGPPKTFFCDNFGSITDANIMQVAIPRFSGPANQMVPSAMTSHGGHVGFQDGCHEVHSKTVFCHNLGSTDTNLFQVAIYLGVWVRPIKWYHRRWRHIVAILDSKMADMRPITKRFFATLWFYYRYYRNDIRNNSKVRVLWYY